MRISDLSRRTGVPVPTIKYYLREGLLPPGEITSRTQARYTEAHVRRLRLIRALIDVGGLPVASTRAVLDAVADPSLGMHERLGAAQYALGREPQAPTDDAEWKATRADVDGFLDDLGWDLGAESPARELLTRSVVALRALGYRCDADDLGRYADAMLTLAEGDLDVIDEYTHVEEAVEAAVTLTLLYEPVMTALRRLAHEHVSYQRNAAPDADDAPG